MMSDDWPQIKARLEQDAEECENGNEYVIDGEKQTKAFAADIRAALQRVEELKEMARTCQNTISVRSLQLEAAEAEVKRLEAALRRADEQYKQLLEDLKRA